MGRHGLPSWRPIESLNIKLFDGKPIDQFSLSALLGFSFGSIEGNQYTGFQSFPKFESIHKQQERKSSVVIRDEIMLDLLRMYQQEFHQRKKSRRQIEINKNGKITELILQQDLQMFFNEVSRKIGFEMSIEVESSQSRERGSGRIDFKVGIYDTDKDHLVYRYGIECKISNNPNVQESELAQCKEYIAAFSQTGEPRNSNRMDAVFLLRGVTGDQDIYPLQGTSTYTEDSIPIHVIKIALQPKRPSKQRETRDIAHAVFPVKYQEGEVTHVLFTKCKKDEAPRLPGGKLKAGENARQCLIRELNEELNLEIRHIKEIFQIKGGSKHDTSGFRAEEIEKIDEGSGFSIEEHSLSRGEYNNFRLHPFLISLTDEGKNHIKENMNSAPHFSRPAPLSEWLEYGLGNSPTYPQMMEPFLDFELMKEIAIDLRV